MLASEYDPERKGKRQYVQEAYKLLHPGVPVVGDVRELDSEDVPDHDVLSFTFPCQSFSQAGNRRGFEDIRGTLYFEAMRVVREKKPKIIFAENVKGIIGNDGGRTLETIIKVANDCGYIVDYTVLNSMYFGVHQNRERWFMIGIRDDLIEKENWTDTEGTTILPKSKRRIGEWAMTFNFDWPSQKEITTDIRDFLEKEVDYKYIIDEVKTARLLEQLDGSPQAGEIRPVITPDRINKRQNGRRFKESGEAMFTLTAQDRHGIAEVFTDSHRIRRITPRESFRLQAFPEEAFDRLRAAGYSDSLLYRMAGNAVTVNVVEAIGGRLIPLLLQTKHKRFARP